MVICYNMPNSHYWLCLTSSSLNDQTHNHHIMKTHKHILLAVIFTAAFLPHLGAQTLLLNWNFDESDSGTANATDHGAAPLAPGTFNGGATRTGNTPAGYSLGAADVTSAATAMVVATPTTLDGKLDSLTAYTFSLWVNLQADPAANQRIFRVGSHSFDNGFGLRVSTPGSGTISAGNFGLTMDQTASGVDFGVSVGADNSWLFVAVTWEASTGDTNLYVGTDTANAQWIASGVRGIAHTGIVTADLGVGGYPALANRAVSAYLDDFRIYSGVADQNFIESIRVSNIPEPRLAALLLGGMGICLVLARRRMFRDVG